MGNQVHTSKSKSTLAWLVWGLAASYFFSDYFARVSPSVMGRELQLAFSVSAAGLGSLSAFFYYPYVAMQIPVGLLVDRYSTRSLLTVMALLTAVGCTVFGLAGNVWVASIGRFLIGFSAAFAFVSALRLASMWFPPSRLGLLAGLTQALGMLGAAVGEAPVSFLVAVVGWRHACLLMAFVFVILACLICFFVQDRPTHIKITHKKMPVLSVGASLKKILSNKQTWFNAFYVGLLFAPTAVIGELWGASYLQYGRGIHQHTAAFIDGLIFIGWGFGGPLSGWVSDKIGRRKPVMCFSAISGFVLLSIILYWPVLNTVMLGVLFFLFGLTNFGVSIAYAVATEINPKQVVGTSIAFANMSSVILGAFMQPLVGLLMDAYAHKNVFDISALSRADFNAAFVLLPLCSLLAFCFSLLVKETNCRQKIHVV